MFFKRELSQKLKRFSKFPVVALLGPRQSGKSTLARHFFKRHRFLSLEDIETREFAKNDAKGFLQAHENKYGLILDEFQYVPDLLSYIQVEVDAKKRPGYFVLTGSQNFLMNQAISQSLAGRVGILTLLPLCISEMKSAKLITSLEDAIYNGGYPRLYAEEFLAQEAYPSYISTYIQKDVRQLINVGDIGVFEKFMSLCAGRIAQELNVTDLATQVGVDRRTVVKWLSILESSYIIFLLKPYFNNFGKRVTKTPKLYFYDTGIACSLLRLRSAQNLQLSPFKGPLFENFIIADFYKQYHNLAIQPPLYFWRDLNGRFEVDCLVDLGNFLVPIELKSGQTAITHFFDGLRAWQEIAQERGLKGYVVYAGQNAQPRAIGNLIGWQAAGQLIKKIEAL